MKRNFNHKKIAELQEKDNKAARLVKSFRDIGWPTHKLTTLIRDSYGGFISGEDFCSIFCPDLSKDKIKMDYWKDLCERKRSILFETNPDTVRMFVL